MIIRGIKPNLPKDLHIILTNFFQAKVTSRSVVGVSENLKQIVKDDTLNNTDIVLVTSVVNKITDSLYLTLKNENQVRFC